MALATLIAITLSCIAWSLWIRRVTWSCRWEVAATLNIALQGAAVLLMSPLASETLGHWLYSMTGKWNLEDYIGHDCYIVAASAVVYNALGRLEQDHALHQRFKQFVELPATLCIPLLLAAFWLGNGAAIYRPDFFDVPTDFWLNVYWLLLCGMLTYLLLYGGRALLILRHDPRSRPIETVLCVVGAALLLDVGMPPNVLLIGVAMVLGTIVWSLLGIASTGFTRSVEHAQITTLPLIFVPLLLSGMSFPLTILPDWAQRIAAWTPLHPVVDLMRLGMAGVDAEGASLTFAETMSAAGLPVVVLLVWTGLGVWLVRRHLRWEPRR